MRRIKEIWHDKDRRRGLIATFLVHLFILLALFFLALRTPLPLPGEEGVEVNFGYDDEGYGDIQSETPPPQADPTPPPQIQPEEIIEPEPEIIEEEILTQDIEEAPVIEEEIIEEDKPEEIPEEPEEIPEEKKEEEIIEEVDDEPEEPPVDSTYISETEEVVEEIIEEPEPVVNQRALYKGSSKSSEDGTNQGVKAGTGDMGKPEGYKDSDKYDGRGGEGNGPSFYLGGRGDVYLETPTVKVNERGTVVVDIWVDQMGNVVRAQIKSKGTDVFDPEQRKMAVAAARNSTFEKDASAAAEQRGTITYTFILMK